MNGREAPCRAQQALTQLSPEPLEAPNTLFLPHKRPMDFIMQFPSSGLMELFGDVPPRLLLKPSLRTCAVSFAWLMMCAQGSVSSKLPVAPVAGPGDSLSTLGGQWLKAPRGHQELQAQEVCLSCTGCLVRCHLKLQLFGGGGHYE